MDPESNPSAKQGDLTSNKNLRTFEIPAFKS